MSNQTAVETPMIAATIISVKNLPTILTRDLLPPEDEGLFTPGDKVPTKRTLENSQHSVNRAVKAIRFTKTAAHAILPRKGQLYRVTMPIVDGQIPEGAKWQSVENVTGDDKAEAEVAKWDADVKKARDEARAAAKAAREAAKAAQAEAEEASE